MNKELSIRENRINLIKILHDEKGDNWQDVFTPLDICTEMVKLVHGENRNYGVLFSIEFLEVMIHDFSIPPKNIVFFADGKVQSKLVEKVYGVKSVILPKNEILAGGFNKEIFSNTLKNNLIFSNEEDMKFNKLAVVGNPPYQMNNDKGGSAAHASPLYNLFIESIIDNLSPDYLTMIVPSRWMAGGRGLDNFRKRMMNDKRMKTIVHFPGEKTIFPTVSITGGVNYFSWEKDYSGPCNFNGNNRYLNEFDDIIVMDNNSLNIIKKINNIHNNFMNKEFSIQTPFGLHTSFKDWKSNGVKCYSAGMKENFCAKDIFSDKYKIINKWKVAIGKANGAAQKELDGVKRVLGDCYIFEPGSICTQTYIVVNVFDTKKEAENFITYLKTKFFRFMLSIRVITQDINKEKFAFVPDVEDYSKPWTDAELYKMFNLSKEEIEYIENKIKEFK